MAGQIGQGGGRSDVHWNGPRPFHHCLCHVQPTRPRRRRGRHRVPSGHHHRPCRCQRDVGLDSGILYREGGGRRALALVHVEGCLGHGPPSRLLPPAGAPLVLARDVRRLAGDCAGLPGGPPAEVAGRRRFRRAALRGHLLADAPRRTHRRLRPCPRAHRSIRWDRRRAPARHGHHRQPRLHPEPGPRDLRGLRPGRNTRRGHRAAGCD
mmetsp:Transcript_119728/g.298638  ORF Transcript_119728/g.298638 Transcript_119728/m.298638 type:complete len:209 (+) Transcript_119728:86-712(+)